MLTRLIIVGYKQNTVLMRPVALVAKGQKIISVGSFHQLKFCCPKMGHYKKWKKVSVFEVQLDSENLSQFATENGSNLVVVL
jgi:hypothetical protein